MTSQSSPKLGHIWPLLLLLGADAVILLEAPVYLSYTASIILLLFLPGWVWLEALFPKSETIGERLIVATGLSIAITIFGAMLAVYLPGPISASRLLLLLNLVIITGLGLSWQRAFLAPPSTSDPPNASSLPPVKRSMIWLLLLILLALALRLPRLGYAEFHEDEAEALMLAVRLLQGEDYALFLHRKGPAQMLLPLAFWLLTGQINEALARFPFALSSILSVGALFLIGHRWFGRRAGLFAALLWAINGYAIAFGRMVQYQALIFFLGPLALYCLFLAWQQSRPRWQFLGAIFLATSLLAHFDALLLLPAALFLGVTILRNPTSPSPQPSPKERGSKTSPPPGGIEEGLSTPEPKGRGSLSSPLLPTALALALFLALLAVFYIPYTLDPEFSNTTTYLTESRIQPGLLYNNLDLLRRFDRDYSSHFFLLALAIGLVSYTIRQTFRLSKLWRWLIFGLLVLIALTFWSPELWQMGSLNLAIIPWLLLGVICFWTAPTVGARAAWLMFGAGVIGYVFLVRDPRTHLYIFYPGAVLLAGAGWAMLTAQPPVRYAALGLVTILTVAIVTYVTAIFLQTESTFSHLRDRWDGSLWETVYDDVPRPREYFGYPKREGWKAIGALRAQGLFPGDFRSVNEDFIIPIWYNFGEARSCYDTPAHFFVRLTDAGELEPEAAYTQVGEILREGEVRLSIFEADRGSPARFESYTLEDYAQTFDRLATPQQFRQQADPTQQVGARFGQAIEFVGYDLPAATVAPGETLYLDLHWRAIQAPADSYRAFVHLTDGTTLWSQQDDDPACRLPTAIWRAGQRGLGQFRLDIPPDMPPGRYPLIIGLYHTDTLERLQITGGAGQLGDDFLWLRDIEVVEP